MPLEFRGLALMDPPGRGVKFAGYPKGRRDMPIVVCEVTTELLRVLADLQYGDPDELMGVFELHKDDLFARCSAKFDAGEHRPRISISDYATENETDSKFTSAE